MIKRQNILWKKALLTYEYTAKDTIKYILYCEVIQKCP